MGIRKESIFHEVFGIEYKDYIKQFQEMVLTSCEYVEGII